MRALLDALLTGALAVPPDLPVAHLEADSKLYGELFGQVTIDEAVNARGHDELYERLFTANHMDALDLLFMHFMWANHTGTLRAPGGTVADRPLPDRHTRAAEKNSSQPTGGATASSPAAPPREQGNSQNASLPVASGKPAAASRDWVVSGAAEGGPSEASGLSSQHATGKKLRGVLSRLRRFTSLYARWKHPIEEKISVLNATGAGDATFTLFEDRRWLGVEYYNAASGRSRKIEIEVPDAEYLLAELLAVEGELLVDRRGHPLPEPRAIKAHAERTYLREFEGILLELRRSTADAEEFLEDVAAEGDVLQAANRSNHSDDVGRLLAGDRPEVPVAPPLILALGVPCVVVAAVLAVALAPPLPPPEPGRPPQRAVAWASRVLAWLHCANAALERLEARLGFAARQEAEPAAAPRQPGPRRLPES
mmetsp:Transcript_37905/g.117856  ORF Transcript_37905/g.117856 Transcript_37905/m.117856 type:complete len:425 (-) Transcript_37905:119-1393(-)